MKISINNKSCLKLYEFKVQSNNRKELTIKCNGHIFRIY